MVIRFTTLALVMIVVKERNKMDKKENKDEKVIEIKGGPKFWQKYLEKLRKAKEEGCTTCGCCK